MILRPERVPEPRVGPAKRFTLLGAAWRFLMDTPSLWLLGAASAAVNVWLSWNLTRVPFSEWGDVPTPLLERLFDGLRFALLSAIVVAIRLRARLVSRTPLKYRPTDGANELLFRALPSLAMLEITLMLYWALLAATSPVAAFIGGLVMFPLAFAVPAILDAGSLERGVRRALSLLKGRWLDALFIGFVPGAAFGSGGGIVGAMLIDGLPEETAPYALLVWTSITGAVALLWAESLRAFVYRDTVEFGPRQPRT